MRLKIFLVLVCCSVFLTFRYMQGLRLCSSDEDEAVGSGEN